MAGVLIIMIFIMFIIVFMILFIIEHNLITDRPTIDNITSQVLILNVYFAHWPVEATLGEAMWGIFGGGYFSVGNHQQLPCLFYRMQSQHSTTW